MEAYFFSQARGRHADESDFVVPKELRDELETRFSGVDLPGRVKRARNYVLNATFGSESTYSRPEPEKGYPRGPIAPVLVAVKALKRYIGKRGRTDRHAIGITEVGVRPPLEKGPLDPRGPLQPYLCSKNDHHGIDAYRFCERWERGSNVEIALVDQGYVPHADLPSVEVHKIQHSDSGEQQLQVDSDHHGTAMLGVLVARRDAGSPPPREYIDGIADRAAKVRMVPFSSVGTGQNSGVWDSNVFSAITLAILRCKRPAILVVPVDAVMVRGNPPKRKNSPRLGLEAWPLARALFVLADYLGIIPVISAGNGYGARIESFAKIRTKDFYPSPAIVVAGGLPREKGPCRDSNLGRRVDLHCWGKSVTSLYGKDALTHRFNGTSSATAIVAGAVAGVYSVLCEKKGKDVPNPSRLVRNILWTTGYLHYPGLGRRPDLAEARNALERANWDAERLPARIRGDWRPCKPS